MFPGPYYDKKNFRYLPNTEFVNLLKEGILLKVKHPDFFWNFGIRLTTNDTPFLNETAVDEFYDDYIDLCFSISLDGHGEETIFKGVSLFRL
jgi:hypothetical protein